MSIASYRTAVRDKCASEMPYLKTCLTHPGRFEAGEMKRWAIKAPSVLISCLGVSKAEEQGGERFAVCSWGAVIVTRDQVAEKKDLQAITIVETLLGLALSNAWKGDHTPDDISAENHFSGSLDKTGVSIWSVAWKAGVELETTPGVASLDDFETLYAKYDLAPAFDGQIEAEDAIQLQGTFMASYGQMHISSPAATSVAVAGTYVKAAGVTAEDSVDGFDMTASNRMSFLGTVPTPVLVSVPVSLSVASGATVTLALAKNGTVDLDTEIDRKLAAGDLDACSVQGVFSLTENDYVELWLTADDAIGVTVGKMTLVARAA